MDQLILKRASASRPSGEWNEDDFDVLADGAVVGRIFKANAAPVGMPWMWTLIFLTIKEMSPARRPWSPLPRAGGGSKWQGPIRVNKAGSSQVRHLLKILFSLMSFAKSSGPF